jgi:hypothetical protein
MIGSGIGKDENTTRGEAIMKTCVTCQEPVELLGGEWTAPDGGINCMGDLSAPWTPHRPADD